jgi:hypothetical protein
LHRRTKELGQLDDFGVQLIYCGDDLGIACASAIF